MISLAHSACLYTTFRRRTRGDCRLMINSRQIRFVNVELIGPDHLSSELLPLVKMYQRLRELA
jgi:hypothetical protein